MDKFIYTAMTSGKHTMEQMATTTHNLANANTDGFRSQLDVFRAVPVVSADLPVQAFVVDSTAGSDFTPGSIHLTDRPLDVAIQGRGWLAVQTTDGKEAYTRSGSLKVDENGVLQTRDGLPVLSDGGTLTIPPDQLVTFSRDGTVSAIPAGTKVANGTVLGRLKLVNPDEKSLVRGDDGLFRTKDGVAADADATVTLLGGSIESSNVSVVDSMVSMINLARQFDLHVKLLQNAQTNDEKASMVLNLS